MDHPRTWPIWCEVCRKGGTMNEVAMGNLGWRLAPNRIAAYVCSPECDRIFIKNQKEAKSAG